MLRAFLLAVLNGLDVSACDIQNAYLTADCREKIYTIAGPEFGSERGSIMVIKKALYGLKYTRVAFRHYLPKDYTKLDLAHQRQIQMSG